jgi:signal transduction histidine kinase
MATASQTQFLLFHPLLRRQLGALNLAALEQGHSLVNVDEICVPAKLAQLLTQVQKAYQDQDAFQQQQLATLDRANQEAVAMAKELQARTEKAQAAQRESNAALKELMQARQQLLNQEKLASIGTLAAGIAHEINTPTQFVSDNLSFLTDAFADLCRIVEQLRKSAAPLQLPEGAMDLEFLNAEIPAALRQSCEGLERVAKIVRSVKEFSHPGGTGRSAVDLNRAIQSTLTVCHNEWKYVAEVETELDPHLPLVPCVPGEVNQVILNLVVNAAQAIEDRQRKEAGVKQTGHIKVRTRRIDDAVQISVSDNGCGIPPEVAGRIFDPFFTTKEVGRGTGQGLAIARSVIVQKHQGEMSFESEPGKGTTFNIFLPLAGSPT